MPDGNDDREFITHPAGDITPRPDPTTLTTAQLIRELNSLRQLIESRLAGIDSRIDLVRMHLDKVPSEIKESSKDALLLAERSLNSALQSLKELRESQFKGLENKVDEIKSRLVSLERSAGGRKEITVTVLIVVVVMVATWASLISFVKLT